MPHPKSLPRLLFRSRANLVRLLLLLLVGWTFFEVSHIRRGAPVLSSPPNPGDDTRIFITALAWNSEPVLRDFWNDALVSLVQTLGVHNVYVSISESGSYYDDTRGALGELRARLDSLGVPNLITVSYENHEDVQRDMIDTPGGETCARRIPYLAGLRNGALKPLWELARKGEWFDRVLFLNDVMFTSNDVLRLLDTNDGSYAAACGLDFKHPPQYYDTFALRELDGNEPASQGWPYFGLTGSVNDLIKGQPILVKSCWNGIVAMKADPFYHHTQPLDFRALPLSLAEKHLEASECCLIHADNPLSNTLGVWVNPNVRVGYSREAYQAVNGNGVWPSALTMARGIWKNRLSQLVPWPSSRRSIHRRVADWKVEGRKRSEPGEFCITDEMQVLALDGWRHV